MMQDVQNQTTNNEATKERLYEALRNDFPLFIQKVFHTVDPNAQYLHNWHIELIAEYLQACMRGDIKRLIINIPPRHMKSISVAVAFPAWLLGHNPSEQIMCASYSNNLSHKHSMDCRAVLNTQWYQDLFPNTKLVHDQNTQRKFVTQKRGFRIATSVGSTTTGEGGNFLIIDDPLSADEARSETMRERANTWFDQTFSSRLNDKKNGVIIVIMQRLHANDLTGYLLEKGGWEHLCLPLVAEKDETHEIGVFRHFRNTEELLHPERIGADEIAQIKSDIGAYGFAGQYQQSPSPLGGGEFIRSWIQYYDKVDITGMNKYLLVDPANSKVKKSDYSAFVVLGAHEDGNLYLIDAVRDRLNVREREDLLFEWHRKYKPAVVAYEKYGMQVDIDWIKKSMEEKNYRFHIQEVGTTKGVTLSKEDRIRRLIRKFAEGQIYMPRWLYKTDTEGICRNIIDEFIEKEYLPFPYGLHDDMLDAISRICDVTVLYPNQNNIDYYKIYNR